MTFWLIIWIFDMILFSYNVVYSEQTCMHFRQYGQSYLRPPPPKPYPERQKSGMTNCGKICTACPYKKYGKEVKNNSHETWTLNVRFTCKTFNTIYMLEGQKEKCRQRYIGTSGRQLKFRLADHRGYIINQVISKATGAHWILPGHSLADLTAA